MLLGILARVVAGQAAKVTARCHAAMHALVCIIGIEQVLDCADCTTSPQLPQGCQATA